MDNIFILIGMIFLSYGIWFFFIKKKSSWLKIKIGAVFLVGFATAIPLTTLYNFKHPVKSGIFLAEIGLKARKAKKGATQIDKLAGRLIPKGAKRAYRGYGRILHSQTYQVMAEVKRASLMKPKETFWQRTGNILMGGFKGVFMFFR